MAAPPEQIEFSHTDWSGLIERARALVAGGRGWVNLLPEVRDDPAREDEASRSWLGGLFRGGGPMVPLGTWVVATRKEPATVGVAHGLRMKVVPRLVEHGITAPAGWVVLQDNPRRGLVVRPRPDAAPEDVLGWLMEAVDDLCPDQLTGHWLAEVHDR